MQSPDKTLTTPIEYLCEYYLPYEKSIISKCQQVVHTQIAQHGTETQHLPTSLSIIVLAIFPTQLYMLNEWMMTAL